MATNIETKVKDKYDTYLKFIILVWIVLCVIISFSLIYLRVVNYDLNTTIQDLDAQTQKQERDISEMQSYIDELSSFNRLISFLKDENLIP